jgi:hypothetical protein
MQTAVRLAVGLCPQAHYIVHDVYVTGAPKEKYYTVVVQARCRESLYAVLSTQAGLTEAFGLLEALKPHEQYSSSITFGFHVPLTTQKGIKKLRSLNRCLTEEVAKCTK